MRHLVTIAGPDGAGKTTVVDGLEARLAEHGPVQRHHHRIAALPHRAASRVATDRPHDQQPYGRLVSAAKVVFVYLEWVLAWALGPLSGRNRGTWTVLERGWWDLLVDPRRYRLQPHPRLVALLGRARPGKGRVLVLEAPAEVLRQRKQELPVDEIERQLSVWHRVAAHQPDIEFVDVDRPLDVIVKDICARLGLADEPPSASSIDEAVAGAGAPAAERWVGLSARTHHWYLPTRNRAATASSLLIHQPMRTPAQVAWKAARVVAGTGALRLLPAGAVPTVYDRVRAYIPPGGTAAIAVRPTRRSGVRSIVFALDRDGRPHSVVKLAGNEYGRARLAAEARALEQFGPLLPPPATAPTLLHAEPGMVVLEAAPWRVRRHPWRLEPELAHAMGRFYARGDDPTNETGLAHGDFAPWNVMRRSDGGWCLIDWEDAEDGHPPFKDPFRYLAQACTLLGRPSYDTVFEGLHLRGPVGEVLEAYADGAGIGTDGLPERFGAFLDKMDDGDLDLRDGLRAALDQHLRADDT